jgi:hypothetical protein
VLSIVPYLVRAQQIGQPQSWESQANLVDYAISLITLDGEYKSQSFIKICIKNKSNATQALVDSSTSDKGFNIFTIDSNSVKHLLHDRAPASENGSSPQERLQEQLRKMQALSGSVHLDRIAPGETISRTITLSSADLALLKGRPVRCSFSIINPQTSQSCNIESAPKVLIGTVIPGSNK